VKALISTAEEARFEPKILKSVDEMNMRQRRLFMEKVIRYHSDKEGLKGKTAAVWGLAFKPNTDDVRESPALEIVRILLAEGAHVQTYDPEAQREAKKVLGRALGVSYFKTLTTPSQGPTSWSSRRNGNFFRNPDSTG